MTMSNTPRTFVGTAVFRISGMTCEHCQRAVTSEVASVAGIAAVDVDLPAGTVTVVAERPVDRREIAAAVDEAGYELLP